MLILRTIVTGAIVWSVAIGSAAAQTATATAPGQRITLLRIITEPDKTTKPHRQRVAGKRHAVASLKATSSRPTHAVQAAMPAADADIETAADAASSVPAIEVRPTAAELEPSESMDGGGVVQMLSPDDAKMIDRAAVAKASVSASSSVPTRAASIAAQEPAPATAAPPGSRKCWPCSAGRWPPERSPGW